jgi:hypothetical protein
MRLRLLLPILALLAGLPLVASADDADSQTLSTSDAPLDAIATCAVQTLPTRGLESSVARITCQVAGAVASDTRFSVRAALAQADAEADAAGVAPASIDPLCTAPITNGVGTCAGILRDLASFMGGRVILTATLEPSGTLLRIAPPSPQPAP